MRSSHVSLLLLALVLGLALPLDLRAEEGETAPAGSEAPSEEATEPEPPEPLLWVVEGEPTIYLFGTIHIPDPRVKNFSEVLKQALARADVLWTELDLSPAGQGRMLIRVMASARLKDGKTLKDVISEDLYTRVDEYLTSKGQSIAIVAPLQPWFAAMTLLSLQILPKTAQGPALDAELYAQATAAGKEVAGLETADEQISVFTSFTEKEQQAFLASTLDALEKIREGDGLIEQLTKLYLQGDPAAFQKLMYEEYDPEDPMQRKFMKLLLDDRNVRMVDRMLERSAKDPTKTYFVAVGTGHYPGEKGILKLLEARGKTVRRLKRGDVIPAREKASATAAD